MSSVCWAAYNSPHTLVNVGMDAVAMVIDNIVVCTDLKTRTKSYYKADNPTLGAGVSHITGHNRFPLFAYIEGVLRPSIHIIKYPEFTRFTTFKATTNTIYADLCFTEHDYLVGITGYPFYKLRVWNFRTQQLVAQETTYKKCSPYSLVCSLDNSPRIMLFSKWNKQLICWDMCVTAESTHLHEVSTISLSNDYAESILFSVCCSDDGCFYIVNDYGSVSSIETGQFYLRHQWEPPDYSRMVARRHSIYYCKQALLVSNEEGVYYIKRKSSTNWSVEWSLSKSTQRLVKMISTFNNETYAANEVGNLYHVNVVVNTATLISISNTNKFLLDFATLQGLKEEVILLLSIHGNLRLVDMMRMAHFSEMVVENGVNISVHNSSPFVAVSTKTGSVHFLSYEKLRTPITLAIIEIGDVSIMGVRVLDNVTLVGDHSRSFHLVMSNFKKNVFFLGASTEPEESVKVLQFFLYDEKRFLAFVTYDFEKHKRYATDLWSFNWMQVEKKVRRVEFKLPHKYRDFSMPIVINKDSLDFYGIRVNDSVIDIFYLNNNAELVLSTTLKTTHISNLTGIHCTRNILTWGVDGITYHFRSHKKSPKPYIITRYLQMWYMPRLVKKAAECYNGKYLVLLNLNGAFKCLKLQSMSDNLRENTVIPDTYQVIEPLDIISKRVKQAEALVVREFTPEELGCRANIEVQLKDLGQEVSNLIDYDMSVTGKTQGIFRKFCLNFKWLDMLNEEARILFETERKSLLESIADQTRIREWIMALLTLTTASFSTKLRAIFANSVFESYGIRKNLANYGYMFDLYRFHDMDDFEEEDEQPEDADEEIEDGDKSKVLKERKRWVIHGSVFEHVMAEEFQMQDTNVVTFNQMHNDAIKFRVIVQDMLRIEFNKIFVEVQKYKQEIMENIFGTNAVLTKIYSNINCMLCLLKMDTITPPELSVPQWMKDEVLERILTVDDSEIKAINRRAKKKLVADHKSGRMLLWALEFWVRALMVMMDGVLEKLWEEEIKKDIPIPEFMLKKLDHEYTLEDQKMLREYEEKVRLLGEDRRKYLRILNDNEQKTLELKANHILKLNERIAATAILKLKYDFAVKQGRLEIINTKINSFRRSQHYKRVALYRDDIDEINLYISKYLKLHDFWEKSVADIKLKLEMQTARDKNIERDFKGKYLASIPPHLTHEMSKLFKRRSKVLPKSCNTTLVYMEVASRVTQKAHRNEFPLSNEVLEYLSTLDALDDIKNSPNQLDAKHWEAFVKLRRQKIENELKIKGTGLQLLDAQNSLNAFFKDVASLKEARVESTNHLEDTALDYFESIQNRKLQVTLNMGQVEISMGGSIVNISNSILMNVDDVNQVNELIRRAGEKKLKAMEKVALFRRQVIFKEWEHKVYRANIDYLKYMLQVIEKCKVSMEFLQILRKWEKVKAERAKAANAVGLIEHIIEQKILAFRKNLDRINEKIEIVKLQTDQVRRKNQQINKQINDVKVSVTMSTANRDLLIEEKRERERNERMAKIKAHRSLIDSVRRDYAHILELSTILELQRLRTYPTLNAAPPQCIN